MNFAQTLRRSARRFPGKPAIVHGDRRIGYAELDVRSDGLAERLRALGVGRGDRVALLMGNRPEFLETYYAVIKTGGWIVPLNYRLTVEDLLYQIDHSGASVLITEDAYHPIAAAAADRLRAVITTARDVPAGWLRYEELARCGESGPDADVGMDDVQRLMYTSGTTARPKGVMLTHGQVHWGLLTRAADFGFGPDDVTLTVGPLYHVAALDSYSTTMLGLGGTVVLHSGFDPVTVLRALRDERVTNGWLAPSMLNMVFKAEDIADYDCDALRVLLVGGEKTPRPLLERLRKEWPQVGLVDGYGLTECQGIAAFLESALIDEKLGSVGRAASLREIKILDEDDADAPPGTAGEILVRGPLVFPGYYQDPEATQAAFHDGWLRTGDVGMLDEDGCLTIVDRKKDMIRSGGENIASSEIEAVLYQHESVSEVAVVAVGDPKWGEAPAAFVVTRDGHEFDANELRRHCGSMLASFKVPKHIHRVDQFPRTPSGKIMKRTLRAGSELDS